MQKHISTRISMSIYIHEPTNNVALHRKSTPPQWLLLFMQMNMWCGSCASMAGCSKPADSAVAWGVPTCAVGDVRPSQDVKNLHSLRLHGQCASPTLHFDHPVSTTPSHAPEPVSVCPPVCYPLRPHIWFRLLSIYHITKCVNKVLFNCFQVTFISQKYFHVKADTSVRWKYLCCQTKVSRELWL